MTPLKVPEVAEDFSDIADLPDESPAVQAQPATIPQDDFSDLADLPDEEHPLSAVYKDMPTDNPDEAAKVVKTAQAIGQPESFVSENMAVAESVAKEPKPEYWRNIGNTAVNTARWLSQPKNMAMAHDDLDNLVMHEGIVDQASKNIATFAANAKGDFTAGLASGRANVREARTGWNDMLNALTTGKYTPPVAVEASPQPAGINPVFFAAQQLPNLGLMAERGIMRGLQGAGVFGAGAAVVSGGAAAGPAAVLGLGVGARMGTVEASMMIEGGSAFREFMGMKDAAGVPIDPRKAASIALVVGAVNAGLEYASLSMLLRTIPGANKILGSLVKETPFKGLTPGRAVVEAAKRYLMSIGTEVVTEVGQGAVTALGAGAASGVAVPGDEFASRVGSVISPTVQATALLGAGAFLGVGGSFYGRQKAQAVAKAYDGLGKAADTSKLLARMPEAYQEHVAEVTKGGPLETSYISTENFIQYAVEKKLDPGVLADKLGFGLLYQEALNSGEDIKIPTAQWVTKAKQIKEEIGADIYADMQPDVKFSPDEYTPRQRDEVEKFYQEKVKTESEETIKADTTGQLEEKRQAIYDARYQELVDAGRPEAEARVSADIFSRMAIRLSSESEGFYTPEQANAELVSEIRNVEALTVTRPTRMKPEDVEVLRRSLLSETKREIDQRPEYQAAEYLRKKLGPGYAKIARASVGADKLSAEHRRIFESAADAYGLGDAESLVKVIAELPGREDVLNEMLDLRIGQKMGGEQQYQVAPPVESEAFKKWFGNSKVVDENGKPLVVYHGTPRPGFDIFDASKQLEGEGNSQSGSGFYFTTNKESASNYAIRGDVGGVYPVYLKIEKPLEIDFKIGEVEGIKYKFKKSEVRKIMQSAPEIKDQNGPLANWGDVAYEGYSAVFNAALEDYYESQSLVALRNDLFGGDVKSWLKALNKATGFDGAVSVLDSGAKHYVAWFPEQIKSVFNRGTFDPENPNIMYQYAGSQLTQAKEMLASGKKSDEIQQSTGWLKEGDDWRYSPVVSMYGSGNASEESPYGFRLFQVGPAGNSLMAIYEKITEGILGMREEYQDPKTSQTMHDLINKQLKSFGKIYKMEKESRGFGDWLRENASGLTREMLYQKMQETFGMKQAAQGAFDPVSKKLLLSMKGANASTFLHESAHAWLNLVDEMVNNGTASTNLMADHAVIMGFVGAEYGKPLTTEQHEKFAAAFETYLREGKAPSAELKSAFHALRKWLIKIYRSAMQIGAGILGKGGISQEVREVMDRMLASEDEIAYAESSFKAEATKPLDLAGVAPEVLAEIDTLRAKAHDEAVTELIKVQMRELTPEHKAEMKKAREKIYDEQIRIAGETTVYKAIGQLEIQFPGQDVREVAQGYLAGTLRPENTAVFDVLAATMNIYSGEELARQVSASQPLELAANSETDEIMRQKYPNYRQDAQIRADAEELVHNHSQLEIMALEREILVSKIEKSQIGIITKKVRKIQAWVEAGIAQKKADEILAIKKVSELSPVPYYTAERLAAVQVAKAIGRKDYAAAAEYKQRQMINHALALGTARLKKATDKALRTIDRIASKRKELFKDDETFNQIAILLNRFGFGTPSGFNAANVTETLAQYIDRMGMFFKLAADDAAPYQIPGWILNTGIAKRYRDMTPAELFDVKDALKNIVHVENMQDRFYTLSEGVTISQMAGTLADAAVKSLGEKHRAKQVESALDKLKSAFEGGVYSHEQILTVLQKLDGGEPDGIWSRTFLRSVQEHEEAESAAKDTANKAIAKIMDEYKASELTDMLSKRIAVPEFGVDQSNPITKETLMCLLLNMGNEGNLDRLISSAPEGFSPAFDWNRDNAPVVIENIKAVLARHLDERDFKAAQQIWDLLETYWPAIAAHQKRMSGFTPVNVKATPIEFTTKDGKTVSLRGGYLPLKKDPRSGPKAAEQSAETELSKQESFARVPSVRHSFTEKRTGGTYVVRLSLDTVAGHISDVLHDLHFRELVIDLRRLIGNKTFFEGVKQTLGLPGYAFLKERVSSLANSSLTEKLPGMGQAYNFFNGVIHWANQNAVASAVMWSPRILIQNLSNVFLYGRATKGWTYTDAYTAAVTQGLLNYLPKVLFRVSTFGTSKAALQMRQFVWKHSQFMKDRAQNPEPSISEGKKVFLKQPPAIKTFGLALFSWSDDLWNIPQWMGAYNKKLAETGNEKTSSQFADDLIKSAIMPISKYEMAPVLNSRHEIVRMFTRLYSFWNAQLNRFMREEGHALKHPIKNAPRLLGFVAAQVLFIYSSTLLVGDKPPDDADDDQKAAWWAAQVARNYMSWVPGLRDVGGAIIGKITKTNMSGYRPSIGFGAIERAVDNVVKISKEYGETAEGGPQAQLEPLSQIAAFVTPYPAFINTLFWNAIDWYNDMEFEPADLMKRRPKKYR